MSRLQNSKNFPTSSQDRDVTAAVFSLMDHLRWNSLSYNQITAAFSKEQISLQKKMAMELVCYMKNNNKYINNVIINIGKEMDMLHEQINIASRHIELLKAQNTEGFKKCREHAICKRDHWCSIYSSLKEIEIEFQKISNDLLTEDKTVHNNLKLIIQNPTCVEKKHLNYYYEVAGLFKLHAEFCRIMAEGNLTYCNMYSELENEFRNKATRRFGYCAEKLKKDLESLKFYANVFLLHKENSNGSRLWFADFINKATTVVENLGDLVGKQIEINRLK